MGNKISYHLDQMITSFVVTVLCFNFNNQLNWSVPVDFPDFNRMIISLIDLLRLLITF